MQNSNRKLLVLADSPTLQTGFARVCENLLRRWHASGAFSEIWVWGIGYHGYPHALPYRICPAQCVSAPEWGSAHNLEIFLNLITMPNVGGTEGGFTHLWMMQDTFALAPIADALRKVLRESDVRGFLYFPVDAALEPEWTRIISAVDCAVAYCEFGKTEAARALRVPLKDVRLDYRREERAKHLMALPHGVETAKYRPLSTDEIAQARQTMFKGRVRDGDFLMAVVAQNQRRKGIPYALRVLQRVQEMDPELNARLYLHMPAENAHEDTDLRLVASQMGLRMGEDIFTADRMFRHNHANAPEETLNVIYNAADLLLTTALGEGWGLPLTEAMAAGTPVAGPRHTAVAELLAEDRGILFETCGTVVCPGDRSRVRPLPDVDDAARKIVAAARTPADQPHSLRGYAERAQEWVMGSDFLDWDRISAEWLKIFGVELQ